MAFFEEGSGGGGCLQLVGELLYFIRIINFLFVIIALLVLIMGGEKNALCCFIEKNFLYYFVGFKCFMFDCCGDW
jgi:hypothetical protein